MGLLVTVSIRGSVVRMCPVRTRYVLLPIFLVRVLIPLLKTYSLCQLFTRVFSYRNRSRVTAENVICPTYLFGSCESNILMLFDTIINPYISQEKSIKT